MTIIAQLKNQQFRKLLDRTDDIEKFKRSNQQLFMCPINEENESINFLDNPSYKLDANQFFYINYDDYTYKLECSEDCVRGVKLNAQRTTTAFNNLTKALDKDVKLKFPLKNLTRLEITDFLEKERLLKFTVWCDNPDEGGENCMKCQPCLSHENPKQRFIGR